MLIKHRVSLTVPTAHQLRRSLFLPSFSFFRSSQEKSNVCTHTLNEVMNWKEVCFPKLTIWLLCSKPGGQTCLYNTWECKLYKAAEKRCCGNCALSKHNFYHRQKDKKCFKDHLRGEHSSLSDPKLKVCRDMRLRPGVV